MESFIYVEAKLKFSDYNTLLNWGPNVETVSMFPTITSKFGHNYQEL